MFGALPGAGPVTAQPPSPSSKDVVAPVETAVSSMNTPVADVPLKLQELKERYAGEGAVSHLDGISVDADGWHMNVRPSNTEPLLRLNLEARSPELMERKRDEVLELIRG